MAERRASSERIGVIGLHGGHPWTSAAIEWLERADLIVGSPRLLADVDAGHARRIPWTDLSGTLEAIASEPGRVCVLASGDPGFFGIVRLLASRFGAAALDVDPAPSSVALAFARLGLPWDDALVVSAHGRPLTDATRVARQAPKVAVLTSPDNPPQALGRALLATGSVATRVAICSHLGTARERITECDLAGLAAGEWDALSVVVLIRGDGLSVAPVVRWQAAADAVGSLSLDGPRLGRPDAAYQHRAGMITKVEVRAAVVARLALPGQPGVLWDVGAGSGSVAIECASMAPWLEVIAVERDPADAARIRSNAANLGVSITVVEGAAPPALETLPDPDRIFVGGGGLLVLEAALARLRPNGRIVATYTALDRAAAAADRLGALAQVSVSRAQRLPDGGLRLVPDNPVFVTWGPDREDRP